MTGDSMTNIDEYRLNLAKQAYGLWGIKSELVSEAETVEAELSESFARIEANKAYNQLKVLHAMQDAKYAETDFVASTGYGYNDSGREKLEQIYAKAFGAESALVRLSISSGTQAIATALYACLRPGDELLAAFSKPYDTLDSILGFGEAANKDLGSLRDLGVTYQQAELTAKGLPNIPEILSKINEKTKVVHLQRSRGYQRRKAFTINELKEVIAAVKAKKPEVIVFVDNCYGEFTETMEPTQVGADLIAGSLIKNPGGGLAPCGGYVAGRADLVEKAHAHLTAPGLGGEVGPSLGLNRNLVQGFYFAPHVVAECLKGMEFAALWFSKHGVVSQPKAKGIRSDIVQLLEFAKPEELVKFCQAIQAASPIDSHFKPIPWAMPGYDSEVIMACGAFVQGSSLELSADGPIKAPYTAYMQGGLVYENVKLAVLLATNDLLNS